MLRSPARITPHRAMSPSRSQVEQKAAEVRATKMQLENEKLAKAFTTVRFSRGEQLPGLLVRPPRHAERPSRPARVRTGCAA